MGYIEIKKIISSASEQGLLKAQNKANVCFKHSINQANFILHLLVVAGAAGLSTKQVMEETGLNSENCRCYLRELVKLGRVEQQRSGKGCATWKLKKSCYSFFSYEHNKS